MILTKPLALILITLFSKIALTTAIGVKKKPHKVLAIGAANGWSHWNVVEGLSEGRWSLHYANLDGFGDTMKHYGFQAAINQWDSKLSRVVELLQPSLIVVCSKGLNVLTHLAKEDVWTGPTVLLSPIPNESHHCPGDTWESLWESSMHALATKDVGPVVIGVGSSLDEETLIVDMIEGTQVCGSIDRSKSPNSFEKCPSWSLYAFPGNHSWNKNVDNAPNIALLIDKALNESEIRSIK